MRVGWYIYFTVKTITTDNNNNNNVNIENWTNVQVKLIIQTLKCFFFVKKGKVEVKKKKFKTLNSDKTTLWAKQTFFAYAISYSDKNIVKSNFFFEFGAWKEKY